MLKVLDSVSVSKLVAIETVATNLKSAALAFAVLEDRISVRDALNYSRLEEHYQIELYGLVEGDHDIDENNILLQVVSAELLFDLC